MDSQNDRNDRMASLPPVSSSCTIKRSFVKVTSKEMNMSTESVPSIVLKRRDSFDRNRNGLEVRNRSESPHSVFRLKLCDNSSGYGSYGSATSFSSQLHSIQKTPSMHCFTNFLQQEPSLMRTERPNKTQMIKESITNVLDQIDKRVAFLRETASELEEEKRKLYRVLNSIITSDDLDSVEEVEREEIKVTTHGLLYRLNSVDVILNTPRSESQEKALKNLNNFIEKLAENCKNDRKMAKQVCQSYLSACSSDQFKPTPVDDKFQKTIVECSLDDQKKIKKKLENLNMNLNKI